MLICTARQTTNVSLNKFTKENSEAASQQTNVYPWFFNSDSSNRLQSFKVIHPLINRNAPIEAQCLNRWDGVKQHSVWKILFKRCCTRKKKKKSGTETTMQTVWHIYPAFHQDPWSSCPQSLWLKAGFINSLILWFYTCYKQKLRNTKYYTIKMDRIKEKQDDLLVILEA